MLQYRRLLSDRILKYRATEVWYMKQASHCYTRTILVPVLLELMALMQGSMVSVQRLLDMWAAPIMGLPLEYVVPTVP